MATVTVPSRARSIRTPVVSVPLPVRRKAARACRDTSEPFERARIRLLAEHLGDLVAYLRP